MGKMAASQSRGLQGPRSCGVPGQRGGALPVLASRIHRWHPESPEPPPPPALRPPAGLTEPSLNIAGQAQPRPAVIRDTGQQLGNPGTERTARQPGIT